MSVLHGLASPEARQTQPSLAHLGPGTCLQTDHSQRLLFQPHSIGSVWSIKSLLETFFEDHLLEEFKVYIKIEGKVQSFSLHPHSHTCAASPVINIPHWRGTFVTNDEPILTRNHPKFTVYITITLGVMHSRGLDKWMMTYTQHYSILQSICPKSLCSTYTPPFPTFGNH